MKQPEIGLKVAALRTDKGITQEHLAELCEVSTRTIQRIENGQVDPRSFTLNNLSINLEYNFGESQETRDSSWLVVLHLSSIVCIFPVPLLIWIYKRHTSDPIDQHGRLVLNFQLTMTIFMFGAAILSGLLFLSLFFIAAKQSKQFNPGFYTNISLGLLPLFFVGVVCWYQGLKNTVLVIKNRDVRYPISIPFIK